ncbi:uncharacterized protein MYCFIDRAFT_203839 [Pseudocercospora fijiensis CIRAD86]|uniref:WW domain-containing protein n=1 Tax=Pseudocercospora fijiensis (strain CIRAD86) TaxID=383855 RepID=M3ABC1_PSEFD|nr:uncharacterized protein MYCFIDRAFT_203839 [Pseudocercospora fijiensis CIRAD86]EME81881.1 hypothetical protein MYCFIDRAFT_203839 [Pseudocercospora fijiensis CIRAD86]
MNDRRFSGLVGELPLLIALAALSQPWQEWSDLIPLTIVSSGPQGPGWQVQTQMPRGQQWTDPRGVVVRVFKDPAEDLQSYERGRHGRILA